MSAVFEPTPPHPDVDRFVDISYDFSGQIIRLLKKHGMTQHQLAVKLGKKDSEISRWLQGNHNFTLRTIAALETAFDVNIIDVKEVVPYQEEGFKPKHDAVTIVNSLITNHGKPNVWAPLGANFTKLETKPGIPLSDSISAQYLY